MAMKTLAIRLEEELHARLSVLAQLEGITLTDAIRQAIESYVEQQRSETDLTARAGQALEEIEREASARREAIQSLLGEGGTATKPEGRSRKRGSSTEPTT